MLNTLLDDSSYRAWLINACDELDLMYDYFTPLSEVAEDCTTAQIERFVNRSYDGGIAQLVKDSF